MGRMTPARPAARQQRACGRAQPDQDEAGDGLRHSHDQRPTFEFQLRLHGIYCTAETQGLNLLLRDIHPCSQTQTGVLARRGECQDHHRKLAHNERHSRGAALRARGGVPFIMCESWRSTSGSPRQEVSQRFNGRGGHAETKFTENLRL